MRASSRRAVSWLCALLQLTLAAGCGRLVLCIESDHRVSLELQQSGYSCHGRELPSDCEDARRASQECCSDSTVAQAAAVSDGGTAARVEIAAAALAASVARAAIGSQAAPSIALLPAPPPPPARRDLRSVVLLT